MKYLLPQTQYFKASLHTHSTISDGKLTPEQLRDAYREKDFQVLAITDHSVMISHQDLNREDFLLITGVEIDIEEEPSREGWNRMRHFCLLSKDPGQQWIPFRDPNPIPSSVPYEAENEIEGLERAYTVEAINATIAVCNRRGCLVTYNHPGWSLENYSDYSTMEGLWGLEHRNTADISQGFCDDAPHVFQDLLCLGKTVMPVMADDTHSPIVNGMEVLGGSWTMIGADSLDYLSVMAALEKGDLYASCGPQIHSLTLEGNTLCITCSPAARIQMVSQTRHCRLAHSETGNLTEARFDISLWRTHHSSKPHAFLRLIVTDAQGNYAVTRAYTPEELMDI